MGRLLARISLGKEEVQLSVTKIGVICFASFLFVKKKKKSLSGCTQETMKHMATWLAGPHEQRHT